MTALAVVGTILQAVTGNPDLVLHLTPLFLLGGLVLAGRFVGEDRIVARHRAAITPARVRRPRVRWRSCAERSLASLLERSPRLLRGPPASFAAAA
jgi:hypothetical protein